MATLTSTVPGAVAQFKAYLDAVSAANPSLDIGTYVGVPIEAVTNNYMMVGNWETSELIANYKQDFAGMPAIANKKNESYSIMASIRAWSGNSDPIARLTDLFTMVDGVLGQFASDPNGSGHLTASGTWQVDSVDVPFSGPFGASGWGVLAVVQVQVFNVRLTS